MSIISSRLICMLLALGQLLFFVAPVRAQGYPNFQPSPGTLGYYNGLGGVGNMSGLIRPQYGYSAASRYSMPSQGMGMAIGLGMYGGMVGVGALMLGSQMMARRNMIKQNNQAQFQQPQRQSGSKAIAGKSRK
jgi:hypothetical protein